MGLTKAVRYYCDSQTGVKVGKTFSKIKKMFYRPKNGYIQLFLVSSVGAVGFIVDVAILLLLIQILTLNPIVANFISTAIVIVLNWSGNRVLVFGETKPALKELTQFAISSLAGLLFSTLTIWLIYYELEITSNMGLVFSKFVGLFAGILVKFVLYKYWVFKK